MDVILVKNEENSSSVRRCPSVMEGEANKCIKRRRRDPTAMVGRSDQEKNGEKLLDQSAAATTTTTTTAAKRSSRFRGVSRHRWTGRFEAHLWDKGSWNVTQKKKGKQVYLGAYDEEESAARAYDLAALKYWGPTTFTNFPVSDYEKEIQIMQNVTKEEYLASLRRKSSGFSRGVSKYRGVARHHHNGRWEARIGRVFGNKYLYLGTYSTQEEAAAAYDIAAIEYRGINAVTNFDLSTYIRWLRPGSNNLLEPQESRPSTETRALALAPTTSNFQKEEPDTCFRYNPFVQDDLCPPHKQEFQSRQISNVSFNKSSSSPTALGLLLRSSFFRELVEKNSSAAENEVEGDNVRQRQQITGSDDEYPSVFYDGIADVPLLCSKNGVALPEMELQEESATSYYDRPGQALWNNVMNMSSIQ
ncbi:AP2-like ethylene-responsive transcription factor At1g16060 [Aristolochia californica]|uniref:AP2-like ethylene-responsive transcription factor At1g16060 n=1 Tax=Aristolochia californica TaxID=171875 RepID=UPI0035E1F155